MKGTRARKITKPKAKALRARNRLAKPQTGQRSRGRQSEYAPALADRICELLAEGKTLNAVCKLDEITVSERTVRSWATDPDHPFAPKYARAREVGYHSMADETVDIGDLVTADQGEVAKARLRVDTRKWLLSKALPKIYGDKILDGDGDGTVTVLIQRFGKGASGS